MKTPVAIVDGRYLPVIRHIDEVEFYLAFDANGKPFYTDIQPQ